MRMHRSLRSPRLPAGKPITCPWSASLCTLAVACVCLILEAHVGAVHAAPCLCEFRRPELFEFFDATGGPHWHTPWNLSDAVCTWIGVGCDVADVVTLNLTENNLTGTLPASLSNLTSLRNFIVDGNSLHGTLPDAYAAWRSIDTVNVASNTLSGTLPTSLAEGWGSAVRFVRLFGNRFNGTLPGSYYLWNSVATFDVHGNRLHGTLPPDYASWTMVASFSVAENQLHGTLPIVYQSWGHLEWFKIFGNSIDGTLPPEYSAWTSLRGLFANKNALRGTIPSSYAAFRGLEMFVASENQLSGTLPAEFGDAWRQADTFVASHNKLNGTLPDAWGAWSALTRFDVSNNKLSGTLPSKYGASWNRVALVSLANNSIGGTLPSAWSQLISLTTLAIDNNTLVGTLPPAYSGLFNLAELSLAHNHLSGTLPPGWGTTLRFRVLNLQGNRRLHGFIPESWAMNMFTEASGFGIFTGCNTQLCGNASQLIVHGLIPFGFACLASYDAAATLDPNFRERIIQEIVQTADFAYELPCALTKTTTMSRETSTISTSPSSIENLPPNAVPPSEFELAQRSSSIGAWAGIAAATVSPIVAPPIAAVSAIQAAAGVMRLRRRCDEESSAASATPSSSAPPLSETIDNPIRLQIPSLSAGLAFAGGAVLGNALLAVGVGLALHASSVLLRPRVLAVNVHLRRRLHPSQPWIRAVASRVCDMCLALLSEDRFPVTLVLPYGLLLQPSIAGAVVLMGAHDGTSPGSYALGAVAGVVWPLPLLLWAVLLTQSAAYFDTQCWVTMPTAPHSRRGQRTPTAASNNKCCAALLRWLMHPVGVWVLSPPSASIAPASTSTIKALQHMCAPLVRSYQHGRHWFLAFELCLVVTCGVVLGVAYAAEDACAASVWAGWILIAIGVSQLIAYLLLRPFLVRMDAVVSPAACVLALGVEGCALFGAYDAADAIAMVQVMLELVVVVASTLGSLSGHGAAWLAAPRAQANALLGGLLVEQPLRDGRRSSYPLHPHSMEGTLKSLEVLLELICAQRQTRSTEAALGRPSCERGND